MAKKKRGPRKGSVHLDKRVEQILADPAIHGGNDDDTLLTTRECAALLGVSAAWLEVRRGQPDGPPFVRLSSHSVMYPRDGLRAWLKSRTYTSTSQYDD
jgi:predicted DNA-binding transcriptional regulator AlpA